MEPMASQDEKTRRKPLRITVDFYDESDLRDARVAAAVNGVSLSEAVRTSLRLYAQATERGLKMQREART
jgi:hypothetical protein